MPRFWAIFVMNSMIQTLLCMQIVLSLFNSPHWQGQLLLLPFTFLLHLYLELQLCLNDDDYDQILSSFDDLTTLSDLDDVMGLSMTHLGLHLHIICSIFVLEQLCKWTPHDAPLEYFLHFGVTIIVINDILNWDSIQHMGLLEHVGCLSLAGTCSSRFHSCSMKSGHWSRKSHFSSSKLFSISCILH